MKVCLKTSHERGKGALTHIATWKVYHEILFENHKGLVTHYREGGYKTGGGGGHVKFYPYEKGGGRRKCFSHADEGARRVLSYLTLGRTYMFPVNQHLSYIKIIYSIIIINNDHINILYYIMPYRIHS